MLKINIIDNFIRDNITANEHPMSVNFVHSLSGLSSKEGVRRMPETNRALALQKYLLATRQSHKPTFLSSATHDARPPVGRHVTTSDTPFDLNFVLSPVD